MPEYFIRANSFAAPFVSDDSTEFVESMTPRAALEKFATEYRHPAGLYVAAVYKDANAYHKGATPLARWLSNRAKFYEDHKDGTVWYSKSEDTIEVDHVKYHIDNPRAGAIVD